jgi:helix-turn-helix protein
MIKKIKHFKLTGPATWCSFNPESQNLSSRYRELHNQADALMQAKKIKKWNQVFHTYKAS